MLFGILLIILGVSGMITGYRRRDKHLVIQSFVYFAIGCGLCGIIYFAF